MTCCFFDKFWRPVTLVFFNKPVILLPWKMFVFYVFFCFRVKIKNPCKTDRRRNLRAKTVMRPILGSPDIIELSRQTRDTHKVLSRLWSKWLARSLHSFDSSCWLPQTDTNRPELVLQLKKTVMLHFIIYYFASFFAMSCLCLLRWAVLYVKQTLKANCAKTFLLKKSQTFVNAQ